MSKMYILDDNGNEIECNDEDAWKIWNINHISEKIIANHNIGRYDVFTVFTGYNSNNDPKSEPILYTTTVLNVKTKNRIQSDYEYKTQWCSSNRKQALNKHYEVIDACQKSYVRNNEKVEIKDVKSF